MKGLIVVVIVAAAVALRYGISVARRRARAPGGAASEVHGVAEPPHGAGPSARGSATPLPRSELGDVRLVATREIKERVRGRIFQVGTIIVMLVVAAAIVIPTIHSSTSPPTQRVGVVGTLTPREALAIRAAAARNGDVATTTQVPLAAAKAKLSSGALDIVIVDGSQLLVKVPVDSNKSTVDAGFAESLATFLGFLSAARDAHLTPAQTATIGASKPLPIRALQSGSRSTTQATSVIGLVLLFIMLTQYCTWILMGVMQEKSSRVVEVLLATLRPLQLLGGKVLGIGLVALAQAALVVTTALVVGAAVGSNLLHGAAPIVLLAELLWLLLGYAFYCWVYAAAGSTAERQDQVQTLAFPLSIPILIAYIFSITVASSGHASIAFKVLAYVPPTAPFCMPVLVGLQQVTWWQFAISVAITVAGTAAMALFAAQVYRRAILQTGRRTRLRDLVARPTS